MPRFLVERQFAQPLAIPIDADGRKTLDGVIATNASRGVTWVHSYVSPDKRQTFCIYDAASPEDVCKAAELNGLPVSRITQVSVLDPYSYGA